MPIIDYDQQILKRCSLCNERLVLSNEVFCTWCWINCYKLPMYTTDNEVNKDKESRPLTIILDIDGCIFEHAGHPNGHQTPPEDVKLLPGVKEKFNEWIMKEYKIILMTGRKECARTETEEQLRYNGLVWDQLIMGVGGGIRVLINDRKPSTDRDTAVGITIERNTGLNEVSI